MNHRVRRGIRVPDAVRHDERIVQQLRQRPAAGRRGILRRHAVDFIRADPVASKWRTRKIVRNIVGNVDRFRERVFVEDRRIDFQPLVRRAGTEIRREIFRDLIFLRAGEVGVAEIRVEGIVGRPCFRHARDADAISVLGAMHRAEFRAVASGAIRFQQIAPRSRRIQLVHRVDPHGVRSSARPAHGRGHSLG